MPGRWTHILTVVGSSRLVLVGCGVPGLPGVPGLLGLLPGRFAGCRVAGAPGLKPQTWLKPLGLARLSRPTLSPLPYYYYITVPQTGVTFRL